MQRRRGKPGRSKEVSLESGDLQQTLKLVVRPLPQAMDGTINNDSKKKMHALKIKELSLTVWRPSVGFEAGCATVTSGIWIESSTKLQMGAEKNAEGWALKCKVCGGRNVETKK